MRGLAEFIMRGRWQALAVAFLGAGTLLFGWVSAAAVALVTLRRGVQAGGWLVFWALLPAAISAWLSGDLGSVLLLLGTFGLAVVLRVSVSLALAMLASVVVGAVSGGSLLLFSGEFLVQLVEVFAAVIEQLEASLNADAAAAVELMRPTTTQVAGILAGGNAAMALLSLLLGRYWQALLYNPGGFQQEFHALRLAPVATFALAGCSAVLWYSGIGVSGWALVAALPLMFCGFAIAHSWVLASGRGAGTLTAFYLSWLFFDPFKAVMVAVVVVDGVLDLRSRWKPPGAGNGV